LKVKSENTRWKAWVLRELCWNTKNRS
jgi:hypothetical protein